MFSPRAVYLDGVFKKVNRHQAPKEKLLKSDASEEGGEEGTAFRPSDLGPWPLPLKALDFLRNHLRHHSSPPGGEEFHGG